MKILKVAALSIILAVSAGCGTEPALQSGYVLEKVHTEEHRERYPDVSFCVTRDSKGSCTKISYVTEVWYTEPATWVFLLRSKDGKRRATLEVTPQIYASYTVGMYYSAS